MRIAIIGYGGVGKALVKLINNKKEHLLKENIEISINYIIGSSGGVYDNDGIQLQDIIEFSQIERNLSKYPKGGSKDITFEMLINNRDVDYIIEMTPTNIETGEPGLTHIRTALENGINVVTSNKGPILLEYRKLNKLARENNVELGIGCTTGGALPTINGGINDMAGAEIKSIEGILNGTTNFILKDMEDNGSSYLESLNKAQNQGIAETDPSLDVEGWDTASKLLILTNVLMGVDKRLENIEVEGITNITPDKISQAKLEGRKYKLVGKTVNDNGIITMSVRLKELSMEDPLYIVDGKNKAVRYTSDTLGDLTLIGGASGVTPAAASILRDIINISRKTRNSESLKGK